MNLNNVERVLQLYEPFRFLLTEEDNVAAFLDDASKTREDYEAYIHRLRSAMEECRQQCPPQIRTQMMRIDAAEVNRKLAQCGQDCVSKLLKGIAARNQKRSARLVKSFEYLHKRIM